jgi:1-acyl-sn-glycerol-3-phosphate acyltransferase
LSNKEFNPEPVLRAIIGTLTRTIYKTKYIGFEKIPKTGPVLLIANHLSYMDGLIIQAGCGRPVRFMIDQYIYNMPVVNYIMRHNGGIPILPKKESVESALDTISAGLENGDAICIFPEGQLTYTGNLGRFKPGIEWIVERDPVPIYPIAIKGLWNSMFSRKYRKSAFRWVPKGFHSRVTALCGEPIHPGNVRVNHLQRVILALKDELERRQV